MQIDGYAIHAWQEFNPLYFESLVQLQWGAPMHISHGGFQHASVRYFNPEAQTPGLPIGVSALVSNMDSSRLTLRLGNMNQESQKVILQSGAFGEHTIESVSSSDPGGEQTTMAVDSQWLEVQVAASSVVTLTLKLNRHSRTPSYESPFSAQADWVNLITPR